MSLAGRADSTAWAAGNKPVTGLAASLTKKIHSVLQQVRAFSGIAGKILEPSQQNR
jgi:hypothetical protein